LAREDSAPGRVSEARQGRAAAPFVRSGREGSSQASPLVTDQELEPVEEVLRHLGGANAQRAALTLPPASALALAALVPRRR
jgi:hypothetical protein